jgi:hypothetical protein
MLQADAAKAGRLLLCPSCGATVTVPGPAVVAPAVKQEEKPYLARVVAEEPNVWADTSLEQRITPWRGDDARRFGSNWESRDRRRRGGLLVPVLLLALVGAAGAAAYFRADMGQYLKDREKRHATRGWYQRSDLELLPRQADAVVSLRLAKAWDSLIGKEIRSQVKDLLPLQGRVLELTGIWPTEVERLTLVVRPGALAKGSVPDDSLLFVTATRPLEHTDYARLQKKPVPVPQPFEEGEEKQVFHHVHEPDLRVAFLNDTVLVLGKAKAIAWYLEEGPNPPAEGPLAAAIRAAAEDHVLVAGIAVKPLPGKPVGRRPRKVRPDLVPAKQQPKLPEPLQAALPALDLSHVLVTLDADEDLRLQVRLSYSDEEKAGKARGGLDAAIAAGRGLVTHARQELAAKDNQGRDLSWAALSIGVSAGGPAVPLDPIPTLLSRPFLFPAAPPADDVDRKHIVEALDLAEHVLDTLSVKLEGPTLQLSLRLEAETVTRAVGLAVATLRMRPAVPPLPE